MRRDWQFMVLLAAAVIAVFWRVGRHEFVNYDDPAYVTHNPTVQEGLTWSGVKWAFGELHGEATYWHPVTWLSHMLDCQLYGLRPAGPHLTNVALHLLNVLVLFVVLRRLTGDGGREAVAGREEPAAGVRPAKLQASRLTAPASGGTAWKCFLVAGLFALHPLQVDTVAWVAERKNLLSTFFGLMSVWAYVRSAECGVRSVECSSQPAAHGKLHATRNTHHASRVTFYLLSFLLFALGLMSKPMLVPLPFVLLLLDYWPLSRLASGVSSLESQVSSLKPTESAARDTQPATRSAQHARKSQILSRIWEKLPFFVLSALSSLITIWGHESLGTLVSAEALPISNRIANAVVAYAIYLRKVLWPADLSVFYLHPGRWPAGVLIGSSVVVLGLTGLAVWQARRRPFLLVGWLWFVGMLVPTIGLVQAYVQAMADRFIYMPIVGLFLLAVWTVAERTSALANHRAVQSGLAALALGGCAVMSTLQLRYWRDSISLLQRAVRVESNNPVARVMLGNAYFEQGKLEAALAQYQAAARMRPDDAEAWDHAGMVLARQGNPAEAIPLLRKAVELAPGWPEPLRRLGLALLRERRTKESRAAYQQLARLMPKTPEGYRDLADMLNEGQQYAEAVSYYHEALRLQPDFPPVLNNLALLRATCAQPEFRDGAEAVRCAEEACRLTQRRDANLVGTLAVAYARAGRFDEAVKTAEEAQAVAKASGADYLLPIQAEMLAKFRAGKAYP